MAVLFATLNESLHWPGVASWKPRKFDQRILNRHKLHGASKSDVEAVFVWIFNNDDLVLMTLKV